MLVVDSTKRMSVDQIVAHGWMHPAGEEQEEEEFQELLREYSQAPPHSPGLGSQQGVTATGDVVDTEDPLYEQILDYMNQLGLDRQRAAEVGVVSVCLGVFLLISFVCLGVFLLISFVCRGVFLLISFVWVFLLISFVWVCFC